MYDDPVDYRTVRERVEQRIAPRLKLMRQRTWLLIHVAIFIVAVIISNRMYQSPLLYSATDQVVAASSYTDAVTGQVFTNPEFTYQIFTMYPLVSIISVLWPIIVLIHMITYWAATRREKVIEREMDRELELEKLRLQAEIVRAETDRGIEKSKRTVQLADDGELVFEKERERRSAKRM